MGKSFDYIDRLFHVKKPHKRFLQRRIPEGLNYFYCFGGITFVLFIILTISGLYLSVYYIPSELEAYGSIRFIQEKVYLGWLARSVHKWATTMMVISVVIHTLRVFVAGAYKSPRELNWVVGSLLLLYTLAFGFTGYLLPWDQKAYWATVVGTQMAGSLPFVGQYLLYLLRGGVNVDGSSLIRFYSIHSIWLPTFTALFLWAHFHMIKRQGIALKGL
jgi:quinol-cytochrome oxidoreductase complex cytochrome b subunit